MRKVANEAAYKLAKEALHQTSKQVWIEDFSICFQDNCICRTKCSFLSIQRLMHTRVRESAASSLQRVGLRGTGKLPR